MTRTEAAETIEHIKRLWEVATPVPDIASAVHMPQQLVIQIIQTGRWPEPQVQWHQGDLFDGQPERDGVSDR